MQFLLMYFSKFSLRFSICFIFIGSIIYILDDSNNFISIIYILDDSNNFIVADPCQYNDKDYWFGLRFRKKYIRIHLVVKVLILLITNRNRCYYTLCSYTFLNFTYNDGTYANDDVMLLHL